MTRAKGWQERAGGTVDRKRAMLADVPDVEGRGDGAEAGEKQPPLGEKECRAL